MWQRVKEHSDFKILIEIQFRGIVEYIVGCGEYSVCRNYWVRVKKAQKGSSSRRSLKGEWDDQIAL